MKKKSIFLALLLLAPFFLGFYPGITIRSSFQNSYATKYHPVGDLKTSSITWTHTKVISDNINGTINWNNGFSKIPSIDFDNSGNLHVVWYDNTNLEGCGTDSDIFYANYSKAKGKWGHTKVISDNINGTINWNTGFSSNPTIDVDDVGNIHVVWEDYTNLEGCSGSDADIFYANYSIATGNWSHAKVISDNINGTINWNNGESNYPAIAVESTGNIHVVWNDETNLEGCDTDNDIFYVNYSIATGNWSHTTVISDNVNGTINWNTGSSYEPMIAADSLGNIHVVWYDYTNLEGCSTDSDIFYANYSITLTKWSHATVISDNVNGTINWNTGSSFNPTIDVDNSGNVHVAWYDSTDLEGCDTDYDIFYTDYSTTMAKWSHATVISDNVNGTINWNTENSHYPSIDVDNSGNVHVAWHDSTDLEGCDTDWDIFYTFYSKTRGEWSHAKVISDNINGTTNWNDGASMYPKIAIDNGGNIHVVWEDNTNLEGCSGSDADIFYARGRFTRDNFVMGGVDDDDDDDDDVGIEPTIIVIVIIVIAAVGAVIIGLGLYFKKNPDKLQSLSKKLRPK